MNQIKQIYSSGPEEVPLNFVRSWNDRNAIALAGLFTGDAEFVNVVGLWWHNRHDIWKAHDYGLRVIFPDSDLKLGRVKTRYLSEDIALVHARMSLIGQTTHAGVHQPRQRQNIFSFVVQKMPKGWVCVSAHNTDIVPGKETNLMDERGNLRSVDYREE